MAQGLITWFNYKGFDLKLVRVPFTFGQPRKDAAGDYYECSSFGPAVFTGTRTVALMYDASLVTTPCEDITVSAIFTPDCSSDKYHPWHHKCKPGVPVQIQLPDLCKKGRVPQPKDEVTDMTLFRIKSEFTFLTVDEGTDYIMFKQDGKDVFDRKTSYQCKEGKYRIEASEPVFLENLKSIAKGRWEGVANRSSGWLTFVFLLWCLCGPAFCASGVYVAVTSSPPQPIVDARSLAGSRAGSRAGSQMQTFRVQPSSARSAQDGRANLV